MGFLAGLATSRAPDVRIDGWHDSPHHVRVEASARAWIEHGSQRPSAARVFQLVRLAVYLLGAVLIVSVTDGLGPLPHPASWWGEPIVFQKLVVWTLVWQLLGLGRGLAPHGVGGLPSVAALSYWLTPGTMRLPPAPERIPFTRGTRRTVADVVLYGAVLAIAAGLLGLTGEAGGTLPRAGTTLLLVVLVVLGLRDRTPLLAARPEIYVLMLVTFLLPAGDILFALKLVLVALWWVTAVVRTNRHFAFAVAATVADSPWLRSADARGRLWDRSGADAVPSALARRIAGVVLVLGFALPPVLLFGRGGTLTVVAVAVAVALQVAVASTFARHGQLESSTFAVITTLLVFGHHAGVGPGSVTAVGPVIVLTLLLAGLVAAAACAPERTPVLSALRHAAGSGPVSIWLFGADSATRFDVAVAPDSRTAERLHYRDLALHALHPNGRALDGLLHRAVDDLSTYRVRPAEFVAGAAVGWGVTSGFDHDRRLLAAIQERCSFAPGELRVVTLDAHAVLRSEARYRVLDAATGLVEEGLVDTEDMLDRTTWHTAGGTSGIPVEVRTAASGRTGFSAPGDFGFLIDPVDPPRPAPRPAVRLAVGPALAPMSRLAPPPVAQAVSRPEPRPVPRPVRPRPVGARPAPVTAPATRPRPAPRSVVVVPPAPRGSGRHAASDDLVAHRGARPTPRRARHASGERV